MPGLKPHLLMLQRISKSGHHGLYVYLLFPGTSCETQGSAVGTSLALSQLHTQLARGKRAQEGHDRVAGTIIGDEINWGLRTYICIEIAEVRRGFGVFGFC